MRNLGLGLAIVLTATNVNAANLNSAVTQETIYKTICVPGWTSTVRPSVSYTNRVKRDKLFAIGRKATDMKFYELDHKIPLALGGATRDKENLQIQPWPEAREKDKVEACLYRAVCRGRVSLDDARAQIWNNWRATSCPVFY